MWVIQQEWSERRTAPGAQSCGILLWVALLCFILVPIRAMRGTDSSWDYSHSGMWMCAAETEDFLCIQGISVFLITLQGVYCKLLLCFHVALWAHQFRALCLQELWINRRDNPVQAHCSGERLWTNLPAFWQSLRRISILISCNFSSCKEFSNVSKERCSPGEDQKCPEMIYLCNRWMQECRKSAGCRTSSSSPSFWV